MELTRKLAEIGQSLWYDNIQRSILQDGNLERMISEGKVKGVTSNPSIFQKAISTSKDYDIQLKPMAWSGMDAESIFWQLAIEDIRSAADLLLPIYKDTDHKDGYVSLEVNPLYAHDTRKTVDEARNLWAQVDKPNLMIKIPATVEGLPAITEVISHGINVNVTLIFSLERYAAVMEAYLAGLEKAVAAGIDLSSIASVASFFVSRMDTKVDALLEKKWQSGEITRDIFDLLKGKSAIANARMAYQLFLKTFGSQQFYALRSAGAQLQRPLWASTSTKNPDYRDVVYVEELIGADTVNTVPPATLDAFFDHGKAENTIDHDLDQAAITFSKLEEIGIPVTQVTDELELEGVASFADAFSQLLKAVESRRQAAARETGILSHQVQFEVEVLEKEHFVARMFEIDPSLWTDDPSGQDEIRIRMNWLTAPKSSAHLVKVGQELLADCLADDYTHAVLLGMGGSSLAPEVLSLLHKSDQRALKLLVLDSTDPDQVKAIRDAVDLAHTVFIVASKSGTTGEINAFLDYFWAECSNAFGTRAGEHFIAITDPATKLEKLANDRAFRKVINADPQVGGRNSALTAFGMISAALIGMDVDRLLENAQNTASYCQPNKLTKANPGVVLGAIMGAAVKQGRDKLTVITDPDWIPFGAWMEQLIAESSGKVGKGIVPVANEAALSPSEYHIDRLFVYLRQTGKEQARVEELLSSGQPVIILDVAEAHSLGSQFYLWEIATATACSILGVNSFDQPDVQDAKTRTLRSLEEYRQMGKFEEFTPAVSIDGTELFSQQKWECHGSGTLHEAVLNFLKKTINKDDYVAINAFLPRNAENEGQLQAFRQEILDLFGNATTLGFGPRFLHSTGQLHKGGPNNGVFLLLTAKRHADVDIPGQGISFGTMQRAQAIGDLHALEAKGRRVLWIDLPEPDPSIVMK